MEETMTMREIPSSVIIMQPSFSCKLMRNCICSFFSSSFLFILSRKTVLTGNDKDINIIRNTYIAIALPIQSHTVPTHITEKNVTDIHFLLDLATQRA